MDVVYLCITDLSEMHHLKLYLDAIARDVCGVRIMVLKLVIITNYSRLEPWNI
jgi:hypothetical protein